MEPLQKLMASMQINLILLVLSCIVLEVVLIILLVKSAKQNNILTKGGVPLTGGLAIAICFTIFCLVSSGFPERLNKEVIITLAVSFLMLVAGALDDLWELSVLKKLISQILAALIAVIFGIHTNIVYIGNFWNIIISLIWIVAITNAINHLDVLDGLAGGCAFISSASFLVLSIINGNFAPFILSLALVVSLSGFLVFNFPPAKIYMGNTGSHFLGFVLSLIAILISYAPLNRKIALLSPILILGFPILDTVFVIVVRLIKNTLPFKKSNDHLALRFLSLKYPKNKVLLFMLSWCLFFAISGLIVSKNSILISTLAIFLVGLFSLIYSLRIARVSVNA